MAREPYFADGKDLYGPDGKKWATCEKPLYAERLACISTRDYQRSEQALGADLSVEHANAMLQRAGMLPGGHGGIAWRSKITGEEQPLPDPWAHRSAKMRCATCMWFVEKARVVNPGTPEERLEPSGIGRCRRHAPTMSGYPAVFGTDWCGDHKLDEAKA